MMYNVNTTESGSHVALLEHRYLLASKIGVNTIKFLVPLIITMVLSVIGCSGHPATNTTELAPLISLSTVANSSAAIPYHGQIIPAQAGEGANEIWVDKYDCSPNVLQVETGTTVTWTNLDFISFTVVSDDGLFAGNIVANGGTWSYYFSSPGSFGYSVDPYNAELQGVVIVINQK